MLRTPASIYRPLLVSAAAWTIGTGLCVALADPLFARWAAESPGWVKQVFRGGTSGLEVVGLFALSKFALGLLLVLIGAFLWRTRRRAARAFLYVGASAFTARLLAGMLKNVFGRERPFEVAPGEAADFFAGGSAFPSGHAAHFWGLYFPLAFLFPRYRLPLLIVPVFVSFARVGVGDHFAGDVAASAALSALVAWGYARALRMGSWHAPVSPL